jgi:hypothetical protein
MHSRPGKATINYFKCFQQSTIGELVKEASKLNEDQFIDDKNHLNVLK